MGMNHTMVEVLEKPTERSLGTLTGYSTSDTTALSDQFPASPINGADPRTDKEVRKDFADRCMNGNIQDDGYWGWPGTAEGGTFSLDFAGPSTNLSPTDYDYHYANVPPDGEQTLPDGTGDPVNSFVPNLMSGPAGHGTWDFQYAPGPKIEKFANDPKHLGSSPFVGLGTLLSPEKSRKLAADTGAWSDEHEDPGTHNYSMEKSDFYPGA